MKKENQMGFYIITYSGKRIYFNDLENNDYDIEDIAHSLSMNNRFNGHTTRPYSVAQHSVHVADIIKQMGGTRKQQLKALLHDASEAYMTDLPSPFKHQPGFEGFVNLEKRLENILYSKFGLEGGMTPDIKHADLIMLFTEKRDLMGDPVWDWGDDIERLKYTVIPWGHKLAKKVFLTKFKNLTSSL